MPGWLIGVLVYLVAMFLLVLVFGAGPKLREKAENKALKQQQQKERVASLYPHLTLVPEED